MKYLLSIMIIISVLYQPAHSYDIENYEIKQGQRIQVEIDTIITKHRLILFPYHKTIKIRISGNISFDGSDSVTLLTDGQKSKMRRIATKEIKRIWISEGKKRATLDGALIGGGMVAGFCLFAAVLGHPDLRCDSAGHPIFPDKHIKWQNLAIIVGGGAVVGGVMGWFGKIDKWREIRMNKLLSNVEFRFAKGSIRFMAIVHF